MVIKRVNKINVIKNLDLNKGVASGQLKEIIGSVIN